MNTGRHSTCKKPIEKKVPPVINTAASSTTLDKLK